MLLIINIENLRNLKRSYLLEKTLVLAIICSNCKNGDKKLFKEEESIEILEIHELIVWTRHKSRI